MPILQGFLVVPYWAMVRFGEWDAILADKGPRHDTPFTRGAWRYARAMAFTAKNRLAKRTTELASWDARRRPVAEGADHVLDQHRLRDPAHRAGSRGRRDRRQAAGLEYGILHLDRAVRYEDALIYQEPPDWHAPVRQNLAAVLIAAGRADEAEAVYWEDLRKNPGNGWALFGLLQALKAQGKKDEAARSRRASRTRGRTPTSRSARDVSDPERVLLGSTGFRGVLQGSGSTGFGSTGFGSTGLARSSLPAEPGERNPENITLQNPAEPRRTWKSLLPGD